MSSSLAIQAVTQALVRLLTGRCKLLDDSVTADPVLSGLEVTARPLDRARTASNSGNQLNLFLYRTTPDAAWRNHTLPQVKAGEAAAPPLALTLHYLITAYGDDNGNDDTLDHRILGRAMHVLNDCPLLSPGDFPQLDPTEIAQPERVRLTPEALPPEEMSQLWMIFQTQYRLSAAYQASVVLIDSNGVRPAPPVLRRGSADAGPMATAGGFPPTLEGATLDTKMPVARLGNVVTVQGQQLNAVTALLFQSPQLPDPVRLTQFTSRTATRLTAKLDPNPAGQTWAVGPLSLTAQYGDPSRPLRTNAAPFALAPTFTLPLADPPAGAARIFTITGCNPKVLPAQNVALSLNADGSAVGPDGKPVVYDGQAPALPRSATDPADTLQFDVTTFPSATYLVRLRVDGVDTVSVIRDPNSGVLSFDPNQKVTL